jgi:hypothetical protein
MCGPGTKKNGCLSGSRPNLFRASSKFSFPSRKGTDFKVSQYWIFFGFRQDNEGFRGRQQFFKALDL